MSEDDRTIHVKVEKEEGSEDELEQLRLERDDLKQKVTEYALKAHQKRIKQLREIDSGIPEELLDSLTPEQVDVMFEKYQPKERKPNPEDKGSGGTGNLVDRSTRSVKLPSSVAPTDDWERYYRAKDYESKEEMINDLYKPLLSPSMYPKGQRKAVDKLISELFSRWKDKKRLPALNFTDERPLQKYGKAK